MRRGAALLENTLIQVVIYCLVGILVVSFTWSAVNMGLFDQRVFATDNAMLVDALHAVDDASVTFVYPLSDVTYVVGVTEQARVTVATSRAGRGALARRQFVTDKDVLITAASFTPLVYEWVKTPTSLTLRELEFGTLCQPPTDPAMWDDGIGLTHGLPVAQDILETGLTSRGVRVLYQESEFGPAATVLTVQEGDEVFIQHSGEPIMQRLACLATIQFASADAVLSGVGLDPDLRENALVLTVPEDSIGDARVAMSCAYKRLFTEDDVDGCV